MKTHLSHPSTPFQFEPLEDRQLLASVTVGTIVNATTTTGNQLETEVAINPANPRNIIVISQNQNNNSTSLMVSRSYDGGTTWTKSALGSSQDKLSANNPRVDPHVTFDAFGNAYAVYMVAASATEIRIILARSSDGGATWTASAAASGAGLDVDYPFVATGPDAVRPWLQDVYVGYTDYRTMRIKMVGAQSKALGHLGAFTATTTVSEVKGSYGSAAVGPKGQVVVTWQTNPNGQGPSKIYMDIDADGLNTGRTWGVDRLVTWTNVGGFDYIPAQPNRSIFANMQFQYDRSPTSTTRGRLYMVYSDETVDENNDTNIMFRYSDNNGTTWSSPVRVNTDRTTKSQFLPVLSVDPVTGYVAIVWHDARNSAGNNTVQIWGAVSMTHGATFLPNFQLSRGASSQAGASVASMDMDFGDYAGLAFYNGKFIASWADNSNSTLNNPNGAGKQMDVYTVVVTVNP